MYLYTIHLEFKYTIHSLSEFKELQDDLVPIVVPLDIDEGIMSYRAALLGNSDPTKIDPKPALPEYKVMILHKYYRFISCT